MNAKEKRVVLKGVIQDTSHNNLPGVTVILKSTRKTTFTNGDGEFALPVTLKGTPDKQGSVDRLMLSLDGYARKDVEIKSYSGPVTARMKRLTRGTGLTTLVESVSKSHALGWIHGKLKENTGKDVTDDVFAKLIKKYGKAAGIQTRFRVYLPARAKTVKAVFLVSEHGVGGAMMEHKIFRQFADKHQMALVGVLGDAIQRGIGPASKLEALLGKIGKELNHPELATVPVFTFGHSNGTGFSAFYAALRPDRVIGWISYHSGGSWHLIFPGVENAPGLVMHGQKDSWIENGQEQAIKDLRSQRNAPVSMMIEGKQEHWPSDRPAAFRFILAYCEACIRVRLPGGKLAADAELKPVEIKTGWLGANYDRKTGGMQMLDVAPYGAFKGDTTVANWLSDETFATLWQRYGKTGKITK